MTSPTRMVFFRFVCQDVLWLLFNELPAPSPCFSPLLNLPFPPDSDIFILLISAREKEKEKPSGKRLMVFWGSCRELTQSSRQAFSLKVFVFRSITNTLEPQNAFAVWFISWIINSFKKKDGISLARLSTLALNIPRHSRIAPRREATTPGSLAGSSNWNSHNENK